MAEEESTGEPTVGADPPMSTGNPILEMKTQMERSQAIFCPLQAEVRSSSSLCAAERRQTTEEQESAEVDGQGSFEGKDPREADRECH